MQDHKGRAGAHALWSGLSAEYERYKESVRYIPTSQLRLQEDLRRYLCLRCAGFLEQVTFVILADFLEQKSSPPALTFAQSYFERAPNLRVKPFIALIKRFGESYEQSFEEFLTAARREALSDLLEVRNDVAHGKHQAGQKLAPDRYMKLVEEIYDWLVATFLGASMEILDGDGRASHRGMASVEA